MKPYWGRMQPGDIVQPVQDPENWQSGAGIVLRIITNVEVPPMIEVLWEEGLISRTYQDELTLVREDR